MILIMFFQGTARYLRNQIPPVTIGTTKGHDTI